MKSIKLLFIFIIYSSLFNIFPQSNEDQEKQNSGSDPEKQNIITGTWELVYVEPIDMMDTDPRGIINVKLYFTSDGKLYTVQPEKHLMPDAEPVKYRFENTILTVLEDNREPFIISVSFIDSNTIVLVSEDNEKRFLNRLTGENAINRIIEPKSLQLIKTKDPAQNNFNPLKYDSTDYSAFTLNQRIKGVWETIAYKDVPHGEMPPYGFLNDIWIFQDSSITIESRANSEIINTHYFLENENLVIKAPDESLFSWKISFNIWGNLIINSNNGIMILKLVTKDITAAPEIPLKVVLLKLAGEE